MIEFATGYQGYLFTHEWNFYVFEATPMIVAVGVFAWWYPPHYVTDVNSERASVSEVEDPGVHNEQALGMA